MRSLWDSEARTEVVDRIGRLTPESERRWGKMDCPTMVGHCADGIRMVLGERKLGPPRGPYRLAPVRYLIIHVVPWPKGKAKAPVEPRPREANDWETVRGDLLALVQQVAQTPADGLAPTHPLFGAMKHHDWGVLVYRHLDHHLSQFGV